MSVPPSTPLLAQASQPSLSPDLDYIAGRVVWTAAPIREHRVLGIMGVATAGYAVCTVEFLHGLAMLLQLCGGVSGFPYPQEFVDPGDHPFALLVRTTFICAMIGTFAFAFIGAYSIDVRRPVLAGCFAYWEFFSAIVEPPIIGIAFYYLMAHRVPVLSAILIASSVFAVRLYFLYVACLVTKLCAVDVHAATAGGAGGEVRQRGKRCWVAVNMVSMALRGHLDAPHLLGMPLEESVAVYLWAVLALAIYGFVCRAKGDHGARGWAVVAFLNAPVVPQTYWLEAFLDAGAVLFSVGGMISITVHRWARRKQRILFENDSASLSTVSSHTEFQKLLESKADMCRVFLVVLLFFAFKFMAFLPVTVLNLFVADVCGAYSWGKANVTDAFSKNFMPMHCTKDDGLKMLAVLAAAVLESFFLGAMLMLYRLYAADAQVCSRHDIPNGGAPKKEEKEEQEREDFWEDFLTQQDQDTYGSVGNRSIWA